MADTGVLDETAYLVSPEQSGTPQNKGKKS